MTATRMDATVNLPDASQPLVSIFTVTYVNTEFLSQSVGAALAQTYKNIEVIIVDNGGPPETIAATKWLAASDPRVRVFRFDVNNYDEDDPCILIDVCYNAGLRLARGEFVFMLPDDDLISPNYIEAMVRLFAENPVCTTAAGRSVMIDGNGRPDSRPSIGNKRARYTPGHLMALDIARGSRMFASPCHVFMIRRETLLAVGGYKKTFENALLFGIVPFGMTGFDDAAVFYYRRHERQLSRNLLARRWSGGLRYVYDWLRDSGIEAKWSEAFGSELSREAFRPLRRRAAEFAAQMFWLSLCEGRGGAALKILHEGRNVLDFWCALPFRPWPDRRSLVAALANTFGLFRLAHWLFVTIPFLGRIHPSLDKFRARVEKRRRNLSLR